MRSRINTHFNASLKKPIFNRAETIELKLCLASSCVTLTRYASSVYGEFCS